MAIKKTTEVKDIDQVTLRVRSLTIPIVGETSLIVSEFGRKSLEQIKEIGEARKGTKQGGKKKNIANPEEDYLNSLYYFTDCKRTGFPAVGFKLAMVKAGYQVFKWPQTTLKAAIHVVGDGNSLANGEDLVEIHGEHRMREDMVRVGTINKVASPRYRAEYPEWSAVLKIQFLENVISEEAIYSILQAAGFANGVGEWRPERSGVHGKFSIAAL